MEEVWKKINDYPNYEISNLGNLRRYFKTTGYKNLKGCVKSTGYMQDELRDINNNKIYKFRHRLVAEVFLNKSSELLEVNHIDGNKLNNKVDNLEWCTPSENIKHSFKIGLKNFLGEENPRSKLTKAQVLEIRELAKKGLTQREIGEIFQITQGHIAAIINNKCWKF